MVDLNETLPGRIFICYRRQETSWPARQLYDVLVKHFSAKQVVKDVSNIDPGDDFYEYMSTAVASSDVLLALIGPQWLTITDANGQRRLDDPHDFVRFEIETALTQQIRVFPILVDGARMPRANELPPTLAPLSRRDALVIDPVTFDTKRLIAIVSKMLEPKSSRGHQELASNYASAAADAGDWRLAPKIFLCYRRKDTEGFARGIYDRLAGVYGHEQVYRDIDSTPAGVRFSTWIESRVGECSVMLVLIGDVWVSAQDRAGQRRLDLPKDWVRQEIEAALKRDVPIIPVLVQGAPMPSEDELPPSIADVTGFQSAEISDSRWDFDVGQLIKAIDRLIASD